MDFATIKSTLAQHETGELLEIWIEHDAETWTSDAFKAVAEILRERGEALPSIGGAAADAIRTRRSAGAQQQAAGRRLKVGKAALHAIAFIAALPTAFICGALLALVAQVMPLPEKLRVELAAFGTISAFFFAWGGYFRLLGRRFLR